MEIPGKVVLITGASAGIGLVTAQRFAESGARLSLVARSEHLLTQIRDDLISHGTDVIAITADMRNPEQVKYAVNKTIKHFGAIDILINNAGQAAAGTIEKVSLDHYRQIVELNMFGPLTAMQAVIPVMREHGGGIIINISSMVSKMNIPGLAAYASTKSALNMLSDTACIELAPDNIRVITVFPRYTTTGFHANALGGGTPRRESSANSPYPIDTPEHVANRILAAAISEPKEQYMD